MLPSQQFFPIYQELSYATGYTQHVTSDTGMSEVTLLSYQDRPLIRASCRCDAEKYKSRV